MGHKKIRTALSVDLNKPAWEQPGLHVSHKQCRSLVVALTFISSIEQMAPRRYYSTPSIPLTPLTYNGN